MILCAATNRVGSESCCDLGFTKDEWGKMSEKEQNEIISEFMANVCDVYVKEGEPCE
jgi:ERCC4-related helicase